MEGMSEITSIKRVPDSDTVELGISLRGRVEISPTDLAKAFWEMDADQQAEFFGVLANVAHALPMQLQFITDSKILCDGGRRVMATIGEYAYQGEE